MFGAITWQSYLHPGLTQKIDISDSRAVIQYAECPFMTYSCELCMYDTQADA